MDFSRSSSKSSTVISAGMKAQLMQSLGYEEKDKMMMRQGEYSHRSSPNKHSKAAPRFPHRRMSAEFDKQKDRMDAYEQPSIRRPHSSNDLQLLVGQTIAVNREQWRDYEDDASSIGDCGASTLPRPRSKSLTDLNRVARNAAVPRRNGTDARAFQQTRQPPTTPRQSGRVTAVDNRSEDSSQIQINDKGKRRRERRSGGIRPKGVSSPGSAAPMRRNHSDNCIQPRGYVLRGEVAVPESSTRSMRRSASEPHDVVDGRQRRHSCDGRERLSMMATKKENLDSTGSDLFNSMPKDRPSMLPRRQASCNRSILKTRLSATVEDGDDTSETMYSDPFDGFHEDDVSHGGDDTYAEVNEDSLELDGCYEVGSQGDEQEFMEKTLEMYRRHQASSNRSYQGSVLSAPSVSHMTMASNSSGMTMMKPWACVCGEENEPDSNFCGMCATPQRWACPECMYGKNKCLAIYCGGCATPKAYLFQ